MILAALLLAQTPPPPCPQSKASCEPWEREWNAAPIVGQVVFDDLIPRERLGPGPHTLVISDGNAMTRSDYRTGLACQRARDSVRRQVANPPNTAGVIYGQPRVKAFCVPR